MPPFAVSSFIHTNVNYKLKTDRGDRGESDVNGDRGERGDKVMEFNNVVEDLDRINAHVSDGTWVPSNFFDKIPECTGNTH